MPERFLRLPADECEEKLAEWLGDRHPDWSEGKCRAVASDECRNKYEADV